MIIGTIIIVTAIISIIIGFKIAKIRYNVNENKQKLIAYEKLNNQLTDINRQQVIEINKANEQINLGNENIVKLEKWYIEQLEQLSIYLKREHNDTFLEDILNKRLKQETKQEIFEKKYDLDDLLDKINKNGLSSLSKDELDFLKKNDKK